MNKKTLTLLLLASITLLSVAGVKVSKLTRTKSFASNDLFIVVTGSTTKVTRHIRAQDLAVGLGPWITNSGSGGSGTGEVTTVQLLASSNAVWAAQAAKVPTNNALIGPTSSSGVALTLAAKAGQDGNMLNVKDSSGSIIFAIAYDGQLVGVGANSARLASTSAAGEVWTASDTTGTGAFTAPAQQTNSSIVRQTQLTTASNALVTILTSYDTATSNGLYSLILGGGITANTATNIAQYFATNSAIITSNQLVTTLAPKASPTFTGAVTISSGTANEIVAFDASKALVPVTGVSATEAGYLDGVTSLIQGQLDTKPSTTVLNTASNAIVALFPVAGTNNPVTLSAGTLTLISSQTARYYTNSAGSFPFTFSGTPNASSRASYAVSNSTASTIYITNASGIYDPRDAAFVTTLAIPAQSQSTFHFRRNATSGWELESVIEKPLGFVAGVNTTLSTNAGNVSVIGAFSFSTNGSSWISATQLVARSGIVISNDTTGTISFHVQASGSGGPTTNAPPQTLAITGGTGSTNVVIDMRALGATNYVRFTLTANAGIVVTNVVDGKELTVEVVQDSTGNRTIAQSSVGGAPLRFGADITGFALSTNGTYLDKLRIHGTGTNAQVVGNLRGYAP